MQIKALVVLALACAATNVMGSNSAYCGIVKKGHLTIDQGITKQCCNAHEEHADITYDSHRHVCQTQLGPHKVPLVTSIYFKCCEHYGRVGKSL